MIVDTCFIHEGGVTPTVPPPGSLLLKSNLTLLGAFRLPRGVLGANFPITANASYLTNAGQASGLAYDPAGDSGNGSLYVISAVDAVDVQIGEVSIPGSAGGGFLSSNADLTTWDTARVLQNIYSAFESVPTQWDPVQMKYLSNSFLDATDPPYPPGHSGGCYNGGLLLDPRDASKIFATWVFYYDGGGNQTTNMLRRRKNLADTGHVEGMYQVGLTNTQSQCAGPLCLIPANWQARLGGNILSTCWGLPVPSRGSGPMYGPAAHVWDSANVTGPQGAIISTTPCMQFPVNMVFGSTAQANDYTSTNRLLNNADKGPGGMVFPSGWDSVLMIGNGAINFCYGDGMTDTPVGYPPYIHLSNNEGPSIHYGTDASTSSAGGVQTVLVPNQSAVAVTVSNHYAIWLKTGGAHGTIAPILAQRNSGTPTAQVDVPLGSFPNGLTNVPYMIGFGGIDASTSPDGLTVTVPNFVSPFNLAGLSIHLPQQLLPNPDVYALNNLSQISRGGLASIKANVGSGTSTATFTIETSGIASNHPPGSLTNQPYFVGEPNCPDPAYGTKGAHATDYRMKVWAFRAQDLYDVKRGAQPLDWPRPYAVWFMEDTFPDSVSVPIANHQMLCSGIAYDSVHQRIYLQHSQIDSSYPVIYVYSVHP